MSPIRRSKYQSFFWPELKRPDLSTCLPHLLNIFTFNNSLYNNNVYCYVRDYLFSRGGGSEASPVASNPGVHTFSDQSWRDRISMLVSPHFLNIFSLNCINNSLYNNNVYCYVMLCWADIFKAPSIQKLKIYIRGNNCAGQRKWWDNFEKLIGKLRPW